jgi:multiple sugar transport system permease protein/putative aldouronate transport system permease protein
VATRTRIREARSDRIFTAWNVTILTLFTLSVLYPLIYIVSASVSNPHAVNSGKMWLWPVQLTADAYHTVFAYHEIVTGFLNSLFYAVVGAGISVSLTLLAAYPLSRKDLYGKGPIMVFFLIPMVFTGGMIPTYLVVHQLGLLNTRWALVIPGAVSVFQVIITRTFFQVAIPEELLEAARVDGCNDFRFFFRMVLPLSKPIIAVNALFYAVGQWNSWFNALIYLTNQHLFPLQLVLRQILILNSVDPSQVTDASLLAHQQALQDLLKYGLIVIASIPPLLAYPFVQKHFVKGMMIGSLKG